MHRQFEIELDEIKRTILLMAGLVEKCLDDVAAALTDQDIELAEQVIAMDEEIDQLRGRDRPSGDRVHRPPPAHRHRPPFRHRRHQARP